MTEYGIFKFHFDEWSNNTYQKCNSLLDRYDGSQGHERWFLWRRVAIGSMGLEDAIAYMSNYFYGAIDVGYGNGNHCIVDNGSIQ